MIRVRLPTHLRRLAHANRETELEVDDPATLTSVLDALEVRYPMLRGTIRDHVTKQRRPFIRFFACGEDWSHAPPDAPLPDAVVTGAEPLLVVGAMAGGQVPANCSGSPDNPTTNCNDTGILECLDQHIDDVVQVRKRPRMPNGALSIV